MFQFFDAWHEVSREPFAKSKGLLHLSIKLNVVLITLSQGARLNIEQIRFSVKCLMKVLFKNFNRIQLGVAPSLAATRCGIYFTINDHGSGSMSASN